jgi:acyl carrier protein
MTMPLDSSVTAPRLQAGSDTPAPSPSCGPAAGEAEVLDRLRPLITEVTGVPAAEIAMESVLMTDLGAESIDLLDLSFLIEETFAVTLEANEFERQVRSSIAGSAYVVEGRLTPEALAELRRLLPEVPAARLSTGLRQADLPTVLTVGVFVHLVQRKLAAKTTVDNT